MRGAHCVKTLDTQPTGIIPADAGSTLNAIRNQASQEDHPRGCGEHLATSRIKTGNKGSSPRMRGARHVVNQERQSDRIIPADAGSTWPPYNKQ